MNVTNVWQSEDSRCDTFSHVVFKIVIKISIFSQLNKDLGYYYVVNSKPTIPSQQFDDKRVMLVAWDTLKIQRVLKWINFRFGMLAAPNLSPVEYFHRVGGSSAGRKRHKRRSVTVCARETVKILTVKMWAMTVNPGFDVYVRPCICRLKRVTSRTAHS